MYVRGGAELKNGECVIDLPEHFSLLASSKGLTATVTARDETEGWLYVKELTKDKLVVKEAKGGKSNVKFDYLVIGILADKENFQPIQDTIRADKVGSEEEVKKIKEKIKKGEIDIDDVRPPELRFKKGYLSPHERKQVEGQQMNIKG